MVEMPFSPSYIADRLCVRAAWPDAFEQRLSIAANGLGCAFHIIPVTEEAGERADSPVTLRIGWPADLFGQIRARRSPTGNESFLLLMHQDQRYYYDPDRCSFVKVERTWTDYAIHAVQIVGLAVILAGLGIWAMDVYWVTTPEEQSLRVENKALERQLDRVSGRMSTLSAQLDTLEKRDETLYRRLFEIEPISDDVRQVGIGGSDPYKEFDRMEEDASSLLRTTAEKLDKLERQMSLQDASYEELSEVAVERNKRLKQLPAIRPTNGPIVSGYGMRQHPVLKVQKMHGGVDFLVRRGTPVVTTGDGRVQEATYSSGYGHHVEIRHPEAGYVTLYAHLSEIPEDVRRGTTIERGDTIGYSGDSGRSTGPHLHYEVRNLSDQTLDPMRFIVPDMSPDSYHALEERTQEFRARMASVEDGSDGGSTSR
jgi:murein DD-endopeptidase MepM/ murein hydrolase activator NlpD